MMDATTAAAVAALVVSVLAMTIATAQVLQQYLNTGQLIRICDSVVYGKMPGQGRRVWQYSQFRFRVVYSVPQVCLRPSLWKASLPQYVSYERGLLPLPDLRHKANLGAPLPGLFLGDGVKQTPGSVHIAVAGEACWVSLCRMAQHSCTSDLFYDLHHCDADRCPSDLPVVPMQVSMRDIVTIALMAGMRCTDASFQGKSIAMDGEAGTITSSWHPMLGSIIHFSPRNTLRPLGVQIRGGSIEPAWMARMWDVVTIAGRKYDTRDRKIFEVYEGHSWMATSRGRSVVKTFPSNAPKSRSPVRSFRLRSTSPTQTLRRRRTTSSSRGPHLNQGGPIPFPLSHARNKSPLGQEHRSSHSRVSKNEHNPHQQSVGGNWKTPPSFPISNRGPDEAAGQSHEDTSSDTLLQSCKRHFRTFLLRKPGDSRSGNAQQQSNDHTVDIEGCGAIGSSDVVGVTPQDDTALDGLRSLNQYQRSPTETQFVPASHISPSLFPPASAPRKKLDGRYLQQYIQEKQHAEQAMLRGDNLYLTWRSPLVEEASTADDIEEDWQNFLLHSKRERSYSLIDKWRTVLNSRQQLRQERDIQSEWEIETYYSASRQSSTAASERHRRASPSEIRSTSRESRSSRRSKQGSIKKPTRTTNKDRSRSNASGHVSIEDPRKDVHLSVSPQASPRHSISRDQQNLYNYGRHPIEVGENRETASISPRPLLKSHERAAPPIAETFAEPRTDTSHRKRVHYNPGDEAPTNVSDGGQQKDEVNAQDNSRLDASGAIPADFEAARMSHNATASSVEPPKGILRQPRARFPDEPESIREGVAPLGKAGLTGIPPRARWTKINRVLVNPEALERAGERFEERDDFVIVLRVLTKAEITDLAESTREIRVARQLEWLNEQPTGEVEGVTAYPIMGPEKDIAQVNSRYSHDHDSIRPVKSVTGSIYRLEPHAEDASSSVDWSNQSVYGSGVNSKMSYSPEPMSEPEEAHRGRTRLSNRPRASTASSSISPANDPLAKMHNDRPMSPRQGLATQLEERLKGDGTSTRRRASTRSSSSSSRDSGSGFGSDVSEHLDMSDVGHKSHLHKLLGVSKHDASDVQQSPGTKGFLGDGAIKWLWICQADVLPGYFANPWHDYFSRETCLGVIVTMLEALEYYTDHSTLTYIDALPWCRNWLHQGQTTHPSYAINAMGGVIIPGEYDLVKFECFGSPMPVIKLLGTYHQQIDPSSYEGTDALVIERLTELMALDSWLSFCGRQPEIYDGRNNLLQSMPMLIQKLMSDYEFEFSSLDRTSADGGHQIVKELAGLIAHSLEKALLSEEEQLFTMMAMLRAAKMALCLLNGPDTAKLREIFIRDAQVYLV